MKSDPNSIPRLLKRCLILTIAVVLLGYLTLPSSHAAIFSQSKVSHKSNLHIMAFNTKTAPDKVITKKMILAAKILVTRAAPDKINTAAMSLVAKMTHSKSAPDKVNTQRMTLIAKRSSSKPASDIVNTQRMSLIAK